MEKIIEEKLKKVLKILNKFPVLDIESITITEKYIELWVKSGLPPVEYQEIHKELTENGFSFTIEYFSLTYRKEDVSVFIYKRGENEDID